MSVGTKSEGAEPGFGRPVYAAGSRDLFVTPKQLEVLALVASGYSYADIARMKFYSPHTVQNHVNGAVNRTHARNSTHLCVLLATAGMIRQNSDGIYTPVADLRVAG